jgi:hypothetical protein
MGKIRLSKDFCLSLQSHSWKRNTLKNNLKRIVVKVLLEDIL